MRRVAIALVHAPVLARDQSETVSTVTNLDIHDIARSAKTYGVSDYFIVHPVAAQRDLVARIVTHWKTGSSGERIPTRGPALDLVRTLPALLDVYDALGGRANVTAWATAAREHGATITFAEARALVSRGDPHDARPILILFGTSWGLPARIVESCDAALAPIQKDASYNHLSVRAACAIALDRLLSA